ASRSTCCSRAPRPSPVARARSSATSSRSACSACREAERTERIRSRTMSEGGKSGKGGIGNFFEDFEIGQEMVCATPRVLTAAETAWHIATTNDRTPRFCGAEGRVHPLIVFHLVIAQTVRQVSLNARANLGYAGMIWRTPVFHGDEITTSIKIVGLKENSNKQTGN